MNSFKKRGLAVILMVLICISLICAGCAPEEEETNGDAETIKIGLVLPLTGPVSPIGQRIRNGYELGVEHVNRAGGIKSMGGAKLQLVVGDSEGAADVGMSEAERLIMREKVDILTGCYQSAVTYAVQEVAERNEVPFLNVGSVMDDITERGFEYTFRTCQMATNEASMQLKVLKELGEKFNMVVNNIAIVYENTDWGQSHAAAVKKLITETDMKIVLDEPYPHDAPDLTSSVLKVKEVAPDAILLIGYVADSIMLCRGFHEHGVKAMTIYSTGGGTAEPDFIAEVGHLSEYWLTTHEWHKGLLRVMEWAVPVNDEYREKHNEDFDAFGAQGYSNSYVIADVMERAATHDNKQIRDAFANTLIESGPALLMPYEKIQFDSNGQNMFWNLTITQNFGSEWYVVYPFDLAEREIVFPMPEWLDN